MNAPQASGDAARAPPRVGLQRVGLLLCALAAALWLAMVLFLGPSPGAWIPSMPKNAMLGSVEQIDPMEAQ